MERMKLKMFGEERSEQAALARSISKKPMVSGQLR